MIDVLLVNGVFAVICWLLLYVALPALFGRPRPDWAKLTCFVIALFALVVADEMSWMNHWVNQILQQLILFVYLVLLL